MSRPNYSNKLFIALGLFGLAPLILSLFSTPVFAEITAPETKPIISQERTTQTTELTSKTLGTTQQPAQKKVQSELNLPTPELPVIDLSETEQAPSGSLIPITKDPTVTADTTKSKLLPQLLDNQYRVLMITTLGAFAGFLLAILIIFIFRHKISR